MKIDLCTISFRKKMSGPSGDLLREYVERGANYATFTAVSFRSEAELLAAVDETKGRTRPVLLLADPRGKDLSSEEFSSLLGQYRDGGVQSLVLAVGPADGWSDAARAAAARTIAFGRMTLPHELAAVVAAEQIYRALTILAGHPYHSGH